MTAGAGQKVLVTGVSGYIGLHCAAELLEQGYSVRGTLRSAAREASVRRAVGSVSARADEIEFAQADLLDDAGVAPSGCGDGVVDPGEGCDDGNRSNHDQCTNACQRAACGDGWVRSGVETCDDGNRTSDDGCDSACQLEEQGDHGDTASEATPMFVPGQRQGALDRRDDLDFFVFVAPQTRRYFIETTQRTDTVCTLFASNGTQLAMDNNRGVSNNCAIMAELEADQTYRLRIHGSAGSMGSYRLHVNW